MSETKESLRGPTGPLRLDGPTGSPVVLSSPHAYAVGAEPGGWLRAVAGGTTLFERLSTSLPEADFVTRTPFLSERAWSADGRLRERVLLPPNVHGVVAEWTAQDPERSTPPLRLAWSVPDVVGWRLTRGKRLAVRGRRGSRRVFCVEPAPEWEVTSDPSRPGALRVGATVPWSATHPVRLTVVQRTDPAAKGPGLRALGFLAAEQTRAEAAVERACVEGLSLDVAEPTDRSGVQWACVRMRSMTLPTAELFAGAPDPGIGALLAGLGYVASGHFEHARRLTSAAPDILGSLLDDWEGTGSRGRPETPAGILAVLRASQRAPSGLVTLTGRDIPRPEPPSPLPLAGRYAPWLDGWAAFDTGDAEAGYRAFHALVERGRAGGWCWGTEGGPAIDTALTALVPATLVFGMLGARAAAPFGRLRLAPAFPASWDSAHLGHLRMGTSSVSVSYRRDGTSYTFSLEQTEGPIPLNLVFAPSVPGKTLVGASVDDQPAELDTTTRGNRVSIRLQLPLDRKRRVVVRTLP